jgi:hypothetical protein
MSSTSVACGISARGSKNFISEQKFAVCVKCRRRVSHDSRPLQRPCVSRDQEAGAIVWTIAENGERFRSLAYGRSMVGRGESIVSKGSLQGERGEVGLDSPGCWALTICSPTFRAAPAFATRTRLRMSWRGQTQRPLRFMLYTFTHCM